MSRLSISVKPTLKEAKPLIKPFFVMPQSIRIRACSPHIKVQLPFEPEEITRYFIPFPAPRPLHFHRRCLQSARFSYKTGTPPCRRGRFCFWTDTPSSGKDQPPAARPLPLLRLHQAYGSSQPVFSCPYSNPDGR